MDSIFNLVIILIPLAIFIGRAITNARAKHEKPPPVTVQYEEEDDEESYRETGHWVTDQEEIPVAPAAARGLHAPTLLKEITSIKPSLADLPPSAIFSDSPKKPLHQTARQVNVPIARPAPQPVTAAGTDLANLNHLSRLKQAVVMAEILGPPKALQ